jgi:LmbE family N-acetylglucosaminyl deacetylase
LPRRLIALSALFGFAIAPAASAQLEPPSTGGIVALDRELRFLGHYKRVLMIGAHPDDEDTELLTVLVRGMGSEAAYLSLNRGEGGQNLIGPELGEALGLIRTEELLAARRLDGARQYFTRAYDFGYSKTLDETWQHWSKDTILKDVVRVIRRFRPQIVVSVFSGTPRDGHGQHQAAGWASQEAFRIAGDSSAFPELEREEHLAAWTPIKLYRSTRFDSGSTTLTLEGGVLDPAVGKSFHQIAMAGRSLHRSQDMGRLQDMGPSPIRLALWQDRSRLGAGGLWDGIDTTLAAADPRTASSSAGRPTTPAAWSDLARKLGALRPARLADSNLAARLISLRQEFESDLPPKASGNAWSSGPSAAEADQLRHLDAAAEAASPLVFDAVADDDRIVPGQEVHALLTVWNPSGRAARVAIRLAAGDGWTIRGPDGEERPVGPGQMMRSQITVVAGDQTTTPYFSLDPAGTALYRWDGAPPEVRGLPFAPPTLSGRFTVMDSAGRFTVEREVVFRTVDQARGEIRRPLTVVPRVDVKLEPSMELWPTLAPKTHRLIVTLTHGAKDTTAGRVRLMLPQGWPPVPQQSFRLEREDQRETFIFQVRPPAASRKVTAQIRAVARDTLGRDYDVGDYTVAYPHIRPRSYIRAATATVRLSPVALPQLARVGYVRGAADQVPEALEEVGVPVVLLDRQTLEHADLHRYDAIVVGPRAYETDSALVENNDRLLQYLRDGGLLIVQYQQQFFFHGGFAPYSMTVGGPALQPPGQSSGFAGAPAGQSMVVHDRVTDETAPVRVLTPQDLVVMRPNRLEPSDWQGWIQERGLYFARSWDRAYRPILETHDAGDAPLEGGLLIARAGKGTYVYTGLSFFRQLPAGVPGAFRLFANLLALAHGREGREGR